MAKSLEAMGYKIANLLESLEGLKKDEEERRELEPEIEGFRGNLKKNLLKAHASIEDPSTDRLPIVQTYLDRYTKEVIERKLVRPRNIDELVDAALEIAETQIKIFNVFHHLRRQNVNACIVCKKPASGRCKACNTISYCSKKCQATHWVKHENECSNLAGQYKFRGDRKVAKHLKMQRLMSEHVDYTHTVIVAIARDLNNDLDDYVRRLLLNQEHLGKLIGKLVKDTDFGVAATGLLKDHIVIAKNILDLAKAAGNFSTLEIQEASERWNQNGREIAKALASKAEGLDVKDDFQIHLNQTLAEASAILQGDMFEGLIWLDAARRHMHYVGWTLVDAYYND